MGVACEFYASTKKGLVRITLAETEEKARTVERIGWWCAFLENSEGFSTMNHAEAVLIAILGRSLSVPQAFLEFS